MKILMSFELDGWNWIRVYRVQFSFHTHFWHFYWPVFWFLLFLWNHASLSLKSAWWINNWNGLRWHDFQPRHLFHNKIWSHFLLFQFMLSLALLYLQMKSHYIYFSVKFRMVRCVHVGTPKIFFALHSFHLAVLVVYCFFFVGSFFYRIECVYAVDTGRFVYMSFIYVALCIPFACYRGDLKRVLYVRIKSYAISYRRKIFIKFTLTIHWLNRTLSNTPRCIARRREGRGGEERQPRARNL